MRPEVPSLTPMKGFGDGTSQRCGRQRVRPDNSDTPLCHHRRMNTIGTSTDRTDRTDPIHDTAANGAPEQLCLLSPSDSVPLQFRLSERIRLSGLAHVAALRAQLEQQATARGASSPEQRSRRQIAA